MQRMISVRVGLLVLSTLYYEIPVRGQPHALVPIPIPRFSIDQSSPSIGKPTINGPIAAADALDVPGPTVTIPAQNLGILGPGDELNEISYNRAPFVPMGQTFVILFGVDRATVGARGPDASLWPCCNRPYNVLDQAARRQAAGDTFMTLDGWTRAGGPLPFGENRVIPARNNTLVINSGDEGGVDYALAPPVPALLELPLGTGEDNGDGTAYPPPGALNSGICVPIFYTVSRHSSIPGQPPLPVMQSGANIYGDCNTAVLGGEFTFATAAQLGLQQGPLGDDIDGMVVFDQNDNQVFEPEDQIMYSLAPDSPSLGGGFSAADIFMANGPCVGPCCSCLLFARADDLGLLGSPSNDNVDNIELLTSGNVQATVFDSAIYYVLPGDYDDDDSLTASDCDNFAGCCSGPGVAASPPCAVFDMDSDGDVDGSDLFTYRMIFKQQSAGAQDCLPLSTPDFIDVLLTKSPGTQACMSDLNADGYADGKDMQLYIQMVTYEYP
jgi:hypothetical protein